MAGSLGVMTPPARRFEVLRREAGTTPGLARLFSLLAVGVIVVAGLATYGAVARRTSGVRTVARSEPLVVDAQALDADLAQADATAANAFLSGGIEPTDQRAVYQQDIGAATKLLADAAERSGPAPDVRGPLQTLAAQLPVYTGLVDTARANNRQGFPVGAAYLRQASRLMSGTILPAAQTLLTAHDSHLQGGNSRARSAHDTALLIFALLIVGVALVGVQVWLYRRTNRVINLPLGAATVLAVLVLSVTTTNLRSEATQAATARDQDYANVSLLAQARTLSFRAKTDESLTLIGRGNGGPFETDFVSLMAKVPPLLSNASAIAASSEQQQVIERAQTSLSAYRAVHQRIRGFDDGGHFDQAVQLAVGGGTSSAANQAFTGFDHQLNTALDASQAAFVSHIDLAHNDLRALGVVSLIATIGAALLALWGFQQRINEYR